MGRSRSRSRSRSRERYRRKRSRSRSRSRDRRRRSRSRSRDRSRHVASSHDAAPNLHLAAFHAQNVIQQQLAGAQQQAGLIPGAGGAMYDTAAITLDRKQREAYVGNLAQGVIDKKLLEEFFNQALSHMMQDPIATPPVININMDAQGRFAFVEFRTRELANQAMLMDKLVEIHGRHLQVGRPRGYLEPTAPPIPLHIAAPQAPQGPGMINGVGGSAGAANASEQGFPGTVPTVALLLSNILPIKELRSEEERTVLLEDVKEEASKHGTVEAVAVPPPPASGQDLGPGRAYILYKSVEDAIKGRKIFHTRTLDENTIKAWYVQPEEFEMARRAEWVVRHHSIAGIPLPGLYTMGILTTGVSGLSALNPALASMLQTNPGMVAAMTAGIDEDEVPFEEGWVKLRGFPPVVQKSHIIEFFRGCGELTEADIKMVLSADGTPLGEAFVHLHGPRAKLRLGLLRDKSPLPPVKIPGEVLTSSQEDMERRMYSGCLLV